MTRQEGKGEVVDLKGLLSRDDECLRTAVQTLVQEALEADDDGGRSARRRGSARRGRLSYLSGYYSRTLITQVGTLELRVPEDRAGRFSIELFERYQRSEKAFWLGHWRGCTCRACRRARSRR